MLEAISLRLWGIYVPDRGGKAMRLVSLRGKKVESGEGLFDLVFMIDA